jgi:pimeloyl-ACP methyl ester carboxylesterase
LAYRITRKAKYGADKFVLIGRQKVHYVENGKGDPVIFVPGSYSTYRLWNHLMPLLGKNYLLLAPDYTKEFDYTVREQSELIAQIVRQLELGKVNLMGGAQGGEVVFDFASRFPDLTNKIVCIGGHIFASDEVKDDHQNPQAGTGKTRRGPAIDKEAKGLKLPILYLYGTKTNLKQIALVKDLEFLQKNLPQTWIVALEGGIFEAALKNPEEVANIIVDFLKAR